MKDTVKMFTGLSGVSLVCGILLAAAHDLTESRIEEQELRYVKGPAVKEVLAEAENDPIADRRVIYISGKKMVLFPGKKDGNIACIALGTRGQGYAGAVDIIAGFDPESGLCRAVRIAVMRETPGVGSRVASKEFLKSFSELPLSTKSRLRKDGGTIDGVAGATISSRAVCNAVAEAQRLFEEIRKEKPELFE